MTPARPFQRLARRGATLVRRHPAAFAAAFTLLWLAWQSFMLLGYFDTLDIEGGQKHGLLAKDLWEGLMAPMGRYQVRKWEGGAMPFKLWTGLFFGLLGPSDFALKLAGIFMLGLFGIWPLVDLGRRVAGPRGAGLMALLLLLPCPFVQVMTLWGGSVVPTHLGLLIFSGHALWFLHRGFVGRDMRPRRAAVGLGLSLGLGLYWTLAFLPVMAGIGLALLLLRVRLRWIAATALASLPALGVAVVFTIAPYLSGGRDGPLVAVAEGLGGGHDLAAYAREAARTLLRFIPEAPGFRPDGGGGAAARLLLAGGYDLLLLAALVGIGLAWRRPALRPAARVATAYFLPAPLVVLAFIASGASMGAEHFAEHRYFLPALPFVLLAVAAGLPLLAQVSGRAAPVRLGAGLLLVLGVAGAGSIFEPANFPSPYLHERGYDVYFFDHQDDAAPFAYGLTIPGRSDYRDLAAMLGELAPSLADIASGAAVPGLHRRLWPDFWEGAGAAAHRMVARERAGVVAAVRLVAALPPRDPRWGWLRGLGRSPAPHVGDGVADAPMLVREALAAAGPRQLQRALGAVYRGMGQVAWARDAAIPTRDPLQGAYDAAVARGIADTTARWMMVGEPWPADAPWPPEARGAAAEMPLFFERWVELERRRLRDIQDAFAERAPFGPAVGGPP